MWVELRDWDHGDVVALHAQTYIHIQWQAGGEYPWKPIGHVSVLQGRVQDACWPVSVAVVFWYVLGDYLLVLQESKLSQWHQLIESCDSLGCSGMCLTYGIQGTTRIIENQWWVSYWPINSGSWPRRSNPCKVRLVMHDWDTLCCIPNYRMT